jgi:hypothetical protein
MMEYLLKQKYPKRYGDYVTAEHLDIQAYVPNM